MSEKLLRGQLKPGPHWDAQKMPVVDKRIVHTSKCGEYVIVNGKDVPSGVRRGFASSLQRTKVDESADIARLKEGEYGSPSGPNHGDGEAYCWIRKSDLCSPASQPSPVVASCIDPLQDLRLAVKGLGDTRVDGIRCFELLVWFEKAQQTESIARVGDMFVSTNSDCALTYKQVAHAQALWTLVLRLRVAEQAASVADKERHQVVYEGDDMPNLADAQ